MHKHTHKHTYMNTQRLIAFQTEQVLQLFSDVSSKTTKNPCNLKNILQYKTNTKN